MLRLHARRVGEFFSKCLFLLRKHIPMISKFQVNFSFGHHNEATYVGRQKCGCLYIYKSS